MYTQCILFYYFTYKEIAVVSGLITVYCRIPCLHISTYSLKIKRINDEAIHPTYTTFPFPNWASNTVGIYALLVALVLN